MPAIVLLLALGAAPPPPPALRTLHAELVRAADHGRRDSALAAWSARAATTPGDRTARLALAHLSALAHDTAAATAYRALAAVAPTDAVALRARLGVAHLLANRWALRDADTALAAVARAAAAAHDSAVEVEALVRRTLVHARLEGTDQAAPLLADAARRLPADLPALAAAWHCADASLLAARADPAAETAARRGMALARDAGARRVEAHCRQLLARDWLRRQQPDSALAEFGRAIIQQRAADDAYGLATSLQWRGYVHVTRQDHGRGRRDLEAAIEAAARAGAPGIAAWASTSLTSIALAVGDRVEAVRHNALATALFRATDDGWGLAIARWNDGLLLRAQGETDLARAVLEEARADLHAQGNHAQETAALTELVAAARLRRDWPGAERELARLRAAQRREGGWAAADPDYLEGALALERGDWTRARRALERSLGHGARQAPQQRYATLARLAEVDAATGHLAAATRRLRDAGTELDRWRAALGDRDLRAHALGLPLDAADPDLGVARVVAQLAAAGRVADAFELAERRMARELLTRVVRRAALTDRTPGSVRAAALDLAPLPALEAALPDSIALLLYLTGRGDEPTTAFTVTRAGTHVVVLEAADSLEAPVRRLTELLASGDAAAALARALGRRVLAGPLAPLGPRVTRLVIVPDGPLHHLPFEVLSPGDGPPLGAVRTIAIAPSATLALRAWRAPSRATAPGLLAFGDPELPRALADSLDLPPLPGAAREARAALRYAVGGKALLGPNATEAALRAAAGRELGVLHLATHAEVDDQSPSRTALVLAPGDGEDGLVTPAELAALDLRADLVVLSACRTAAGSLLTGEGIEGLTAPVLEAGARAVVATRWRIDDAAAERLLGAWYAKMAVGLDAGAALSAVRREAAARGEGPATWGALTLVGDDRVRPPLWTPTSPMAMAGGALVLLVGLAYWRTTSRRGGAATSRPSSSTARTAQR